MFKLAVFASGKGSNCQAILEAIDNGELRASVAVVVANRADAGVLQIARKFQIPYVLANKKEFANSQIFNEFLLQKLTEYETDLIVLAGYLQKLDPTLIDKYRNRIVNIHPALLPAFGGKGMYGLNVHKAVLDHGMKVSGITIHIVDEEYDHGPIVMQKTIDVLDDDTPATLAARIQKLEHKYYKQALTLFAENRISVKERKTNVI